MANGSSSDDPLIDILTWNRPVFAPDIDERIRNLSEQGGLESPLAIEYVRRMPDLLAWLDEFQRVSGRDMSGVRAQYLDDFRETLDRGLRRPTLHEILDTRSGRRYSRAELVAAISASDADAIRLAESEGGPIETWEIWALYDLYRRLAGDPDRPV